MKKIILIFISILAFMLVAVNIYSIINNDTVTANAEIDIDVNTNETYTYCYLPVPLAVSSVNGTYPVGSLYMGFSSATRQLTIYQINGFIGSTSATAVLNLSNLTSYSVTSFYVNCRDSAGGGQSPDAFYYSAVNTVTLNSSFDVCEISVSGNGTLRYAFYNTSNSADFYNFYISSYAFSPVNLVYNTLMTIDIHYYNYSLSNENAYNNGFARGEMVGYENGYADGLNNYLEGHGLLNVFVNTVNDFFQIEIIENVTISNILAISFGIIMLGLCIKIFLGG